MKNRILQAIDEHREDIFACGEYILKHPEMGFKEWKTAEYVKHEFEKLGIPYKEHLAVTGVAGVIGNPDATVNIAIIGEMDAVTCFEHPDADAVTGAAHACGHHVQIAQMIGAAYGLVKSGVLSELDGKITFLAVPAEEFVELEYRQQLVNNGTITYMSGKQELIHLGVFDDIDLAMMIHAHALTPESRVYMRGSSLGFEAKRITFGGKAAHGSEPWNGVNALDAAVMTIVGINANRSSFHERDRVRIHPVITKGGDVVSVIPDKAVIETFVRGANPRAIVNACATVDNAANAGALSVGASCEITDIKGYAPLCQDDRLSAVFENNARLFVDQGDIYQFQDMTGSTDMGDVSQRIPAIQPTMGGFTGALHSKEFAVANAELVYLTASKILACTAYDLLKDGARLAKEIKHN